MMFDKGLTAVVMDSLESTVYVGTTEGTIHRVKLYERVSAFSFHEGVRITHPQIEMRKYIFFCLWFLKSRLRDLNQHLNR